ncbi:MAG: hypothetical protein LC437_09860 [Thiohalomonas sp.]|nr:hypothetical protein [Thiohalomonas sp.]
MKIKHFHRSWVYNLTNFDIEDPVMTTIGGFAFRLFDCLPAINDSIEYEGYKFTVKEVKGLRVSKIRVCKLSCSKSSQQSNEMENEASTTAQEVTESEDDSSAVNRDIKNKLSETEQTNQITEKYHKVKEEEK